VKVRGYLEAFYHFYELEAWLEASKILSIHFGLPANKDLYRQLNTWGYYQEQVELGKKMLGKLSTGLDFLLLNSLSDTYFCLGQYNKVLEYHTRQLEIAYSHEQEAIVYFQLGLTCFSLGNYKKSAHFYRKCVGIAKLIKDYNLLFDALASLSQLYEILGKNERVFDYLQQRLIISKESQDFQQESKILLDLGMYEYKNSKNRQLAVDYLERSLIISRQIKDFYLQWEALSNLGLLFYYMSDYNKSLDLYQKSLMIASTIENRRLECYSLQSIGLVYLEIKSYQNAIDCQKRYLDIASEVKDIYGKAMALRNLAVILKEIQNYPESLEYLKLSLDFFVNVGDLSNEALTSKLLSELFKDMGNKSLAYIYCDRALNIATELGIPLAQDCKELKERLLNEQSDRNDFGNR
jgi:tetratricopeptide (TPR) repeat protein